MDDERSVLSPRSENNQWVPSCFAFGCGDTTINSEVETLKSAPILILKGLGTMSLGRLGEDRNILRDDIVTWKQRVEDSLYIGRITYTTTASFPGELNDIKNDTLFVSRGDGSDPAVVVIDDIEEYSLYDIDESCLSQSLKQLLVVLERRDFSGALRLVNDFLETTMDDENMNPTNMEDTITTAFAMHNKAVLEMANGIFKYAVYYFKEAAEIKEALLGSRHKSVIETLEQLALAMYGLGAYDDCHTTLRKILCRSDSKALAARTWNASACLHFQRGDLKFAFKCASRAILHMDVEGVEIAATIALANKGYMQLSTNLEEGKDTLREAEVKLAEWLGADNEIVQSIRYNMDL